MTLVSLLLVMYLVIFSIVYAIFYISKLKLSIKLNSETFATIFPNLKKLRLELEEFLTNIFYQ